jgi:membrane associated rhomboid family serine protease
MFPLSDADYRRRGVPLATYALIALNVLAFFVELTQIDVQSFIMQWGTVPYYVLHYGEYVTVFTGMFLHASWMHLGGNMLFLWVFGPHVEEEMGSIGYLFFYFLCGSVAGFAQIFMAPASLLPGIGASGAIAGVLGGFILMFPHERIRTIGWYGIWDIQAWILLGLWFIMQLFNAVGELGGSAQGGVAFAAHVGGFLCGMLTVHVFANKPRTDTPLYVVR